MADRPIIFSAPMMLALLAGRKTQTRRLATSPLVRCAGGDRLYVREAWRADSQLNVVKPALMSCGEPILYDSDGAIRADGCAMIEAGRLRPGMHMPRWASRVTLTVTDVRVQRLTSIGGHDARCEGVERLPEGDGWRDYSGRFDEALSAVESFATLWDTLHDKEGERWQDRPDVVAIAFRVERGNIDRRAA